VTSTPVILLDVDGVLADFATAAVAVARGLGAPDLSVEALDRYDISTYLRVPARERYRERIRARGFCAALRAYPAAISAVLELRELGDVVAVTSPMPGGMTWAYEREVWLRDHLSFDRDHVISISAKHHVAGDFFADDTLEHVRGWSKRWSAPYRAFLIDAPYNTALRVQHPRGSLRDFVTYVRGYLATARDHSRDGAA